MMDSMERVVNSLAQSIVSDAGVLDKALGDRPFGTEKLPAEKQISRYRLVRDDEQAWSAIISEHGPKAAVRYAVRLERLMARLARAGEKELPQTGEEF